jgi:drug/metabolite transporter (DMT)-like permease
MILILIMNALLALLFTLDKELLDYIPPMTFLAGRTLVCGTLFAGYFIVTHWGNFKITWDNILTGILLSFFNLYLANFFFLTSLQTLSSAKASLLYNSKPFIVAILAYLFLKDSFSWKKALGLAIGWLGFIPILFFGKSSTAEFLNISGGEIFALGAAVSVAISYLLFYRLMKTKGSAVSFTSAINLFTAGILSLINVYFFESSPEILASININTYSVFLFVSVIVVTMTWSMSFTYLTGQFPSAFLAATSFIMPIFAALFEYLLFGRTVTYTFCITLVCVAIGLWLIYHAEKHKIDKLNELPEIEID